VAGLKDGKALQKEADSLPGHVRLALPRWAAPLAQRGLQAQLCMLAPGADGALAEWVARATTKRKA
jgi:hypothetical protein